MEHSVKEVAEEIVKVIDKKYGLEGSMAVRLTNVFEVVIDKYVANTSPISKLLFEILDDTLKGKFTYDITNEFDIVLRKYLGDPIKPIRVGEEYLIQDNFEQPFKVVVYPDQPGIAYVYANYFGELIQSFPFDKIWLGQNPEGNTILLRTGSVYTFIGQTIKSFETLVPIVTYQSPVGNNDVPYPYAIDEQGSYYLMIEDVMIKAGALKAFDWIGDDGEVNIQFDPYEFYYAAAYRNHLTPSEKEKSMTYIQKFETHIIVCRMLNHTPHTRWWLTS